MLNHLFGVMARRLSKQDVDGRDEPRDELGHDSGETARYARNSLWLPANDSDLNGKCSSLPKIEYSKAPRRIIH